MDIYFKRIGEARRNAGLSKSEMARVLSVSPQTYQRYEQSRVPSADILSKMANVLNVSIDWLVGRTAGDEYTPGTAINCRQCRIKDLKIKNLNFKIDSLNLEVEHQKAYIDEALKIINDVKPEYTE